MTDGGPARMDNGNWQDYPLNQGGPAGKIAKIVIDGSGTKWVVCDGRLHSFDGGQWREHAIQDGPEFGYVNDVALDSNGGLWVAARAGLYTLRGESWRTELPDKELLQTSHGLDREIRKLAIGQDGVIWAAGRWRVSWRDEKGWHHLTDTACHRLKSIAVDGGGRLWAASSGA